MAEKKHTLYDLQQMQGLPLSVKIRMTERRIREWVEAYGEDGVYVSFSGGKDSTVLLDIVRNRCGFKNVPAAFVDVPTQYPELKDFAIDFCEKNNIPLTIIKPKMSFAQVCDKYGFPLISKEISETIEEVRRSVELGNTTTVRMKQLNGEYEGSPFNKGKYKFLLDADFSVSAKCCNHLKKYPIREFEKQTNRKPILGTMASESTQRTTSWMLNGCNAFDLKNPQSRPISFWSENDVLLYLKTNNIPICSVYGDIVIDSDAEGQLDGQMDISQLSTEFGLFDKMNRPLKTTGCYRTGCILCGFGCHIEKEDNARFLRIKESHPKFYNLLFVLKNNGVSYAEAIDWINEHGGFNIKY